MIDDARKKELKDIAYKLAEHFSRTLADDPDLHRVISVLTNKDTAPLAVASYPLAVDLLNRLKIASREWFESEEIRSLEKGDRNVMVTTCMAYAYSELLTDFLRIMIPNPGARALVIDRLISDFEKLKGA
jgi:hypothetical protein